MAAKSSASILLRWLVRVEDAFVAFVPSLAQSGCGKVPIRADLAEDLAHVMPQVLDRGPAPEPIPIVDLADDETWLEHERIRNRRVVARVGVFLDVEIFGDLAAGIRQESPFSTDGSFELVSSEDRVGHDRHDLRIADRDLRIERDQL